MYSFFSPQEVHFGRGQSRLAAKRAKEFGSRALLVHGSSAGRAEWLLRACAQEGLQVTTASCASEPRLPDLETVLAQLGKSRPDVVIALGGGSVIDFAKALAALMGCAAPAIEYLEVVGSGRQLDAAPVPLIALPTTAGTGAEATKNAVITVPDRALKVSLRDARMIPTVAIVDPDLMQNAPDRIALASALDAITQVIEPYLSVKANMMTDALCYAAIPKGLGALRPLIEDHAPDAWDVMAWTSYCGGVSLANSGLGAVHGFAGVIGGMTGAPHGEVCGALLPAVLLSHARKAQSGTEIHRRLHWVLDNIANSFDAADGLQGIEAMAAWSQRKGLRRLADMGVGATEFDAIAGASAGASSMKGNPFTLTHSELIEILHQAH